MATIDVCCPRCQSALVYRHGQNSRGTDRFRCRDCHRVFQFSYTYEARIKEQIVEMAFNGYAWDTKHGGVLAYTPGPRTDETCRELLALLASFSIGMIASDDWDSYVREVPKGKHLTGKIFTRRIERNNLTLRTRIKRLARKTICFSRSVEPHEKVIGSFIEKFMFH